MGIRGLTSYVDDKSRKFFKHFYLHDTTLIIDGNCVVNTLYMSNNLNHCFGGEYDKFSEHVSQFFDELQQCNITPIVMFDGAIEDKKIETILRRSQDRMNSAAASTPFNDNVLFPLLAKDVFKYILEKRNIKVVQSTLEVDHHIASFAMILDYPVLSDDSDFYIYDVKYLPFKKMTPGLKRNSDSTSGFVKKCEIFDRDTFLMKHSNLDKRLLPLAAAVLGNDYLSTDVFNMFFNSIPRGYARSHTYNKIFSLFSWLPKHTLDSAIAYIIDTLVSSEKQSILKIIEMIVNDYLNPSEKMIPALDYPPEQIDKLLKNVHHNLYKFQGSIDCDITNSMNYISLYEKYDIVKPETEDNIEKKVPAWFLANFNKAKYVPYFLDMINRQHIIISEQIEDTSHPATINVSLKIISVIFRILSNGITNANVLKYTTRGEHSILKKYELDCKDYKLPCDIPLLENLNELSVLEKQKIFLSTIGVSNESLMKFPPAWRLYMATIKYWMDSADKIFSTDYHLYALILLIISQFIKKVIADSSFYKGTISIYNRNDVSPNKSLNDALNEVAEDCVWTHRYFTSETVVKKRNFDRSVVHAFSIFQNCLRYSTDLNNLLDCPYPRIDVADFFSGTLIYNVCVSLKNSLNLEDRINNIFQKSPSVLQLFIVLSKEIKSM